MTPAPLPTLKLFGTVELGGVARQEADALLAQPKTVALLALLVVPTMGRFVRRDHLIGLLWPETDQARARAGLRKRVHAIRSTLGSDVVVSRGEEELAIPNRKLWCDVSAFSEAADGAFLMQALKLYRGVLMPGFHLSDAHDFDLWLSQERTVAGERAAAAAWALAQRLEQKAELSEAGRWARWAVRFSPADERALRRALMMLQRLGDRAGALQLYEEFSRQLRLELDIEPSPETLLCVEQLRAMPEQPLSR